MMENKRSPCSVDQGSLTSLATKRHKADLSISTKERKEKLGERIVALQQLVSPYGKFDFDLSSLPSGVVSGVECSIPPKYTAAQLQELEQYSLRIRGLCLVPISCTVGIARSNGADLWAPIKTTSPKFEKAI
ncbi:hypothetical protein GH714_012193 [Hevea brasiliensis]|uniref:BHLH domain-containing protein n=1 Tax=Hevea brasiliensis TaxID=3981 RepID=A0A6A6LJR3_HEVBR|nr:hypothetical protein GH714_012193 [Hevea brasiliensis]